MSDSDFSELLSIAQEIQTPQDYFKGRETPRAPLPENVLLFVRRKDYNINQERPNTFHSRNVLLIPLAGRGRVVVNGRVSMLEPGCCMFISPYRFHHYNDVQTQNLCWLFITFDGESHLRDGVARWRGLASFGHDLLELVRAYLGGADSALTLRLALLLEALRGGAGPRRPLKTGREEALLLRVHELTLKHLSNPPDIGAMSRLLGLSESSLRSRFRKVSGYSIGNFQQRIRLLEASKMLREQNASVSEAAAACGWESPYSFSRAFSAYWGVPPKRFSMRGDTSGRQSG